MLPGGRADRWVWLFVSATLALPSQQQRPRGAGLEDSRVDFRAVVDAQRDELLLWVFAAHDRDWAIRFEHFGIEPLPRMLIATQTRQQVFRAAKALRRYVFDGQVASPEGFMRGNA